MAKVKVLYGNIKNKFGVVTDEIGAVAVFTQYANVNATTPYYVEVKDLDDLTEIESALVDASLIKELQSIEATPLAILDAFEKMGQIDIIDQALSNDRTAQMKFNAARTISEDNDLVQRVAVANGWTDAEVRALFVSARSFDLGSK